MMAHGYKRPLARGGYGSPLEKKIIGVAQAKAQHYERIWKMFARWRQRRTTTKQIVEVRHSMVMLRQRLTAISSM